MHDHPVGETIAGRYRIIETIGQGGMGTVYKALDTRLQRIVALKVFDQQTDAESERRFAEARVLVKRTQSLHHPNLLQTFDIGKAEGQTFSLMEFIEGRSLSQMIAEGKQFDPQRAIEIIEQVGGALEYVHRHGLVHRDVKPSNILVSNDGRVILSDFGLMIPHGSPTRTTEGTIEGTPHYMSPEHAMGESVDARSDIFSLCIVLYEMLTGCRPFSVESSTETLRNVVEQLPVSPERINLSLSRPLAHVIMKGLMKEPSGRFPTMAAFLTALQKTVPTLYPEGESTRSDFSTIDNAALEIGEDTPTSVDLPPYEPAARREVQRRLQEFDAVWEQLISSARDD